MRRAGCSARTGPSPRRRLLLAFALACLALRAGAQGAPPPPRILVIYSDSRLLPANVLFDQSLREALASRAGVPIECCGEFLDEIRFPARYKERMRDLLIAKYGDRPADVIVAFAPAGLEFCLRNRHLLFPAIPIVFAGMGIDTLEGRPPEPGVTGIRSSFDAPATLRLALRLHPRAQKVFLIARPGGLDSNDTGVEWARLRESDFGIPIAHLSAQTPTELMRELVGVPENSLVVDLAGIRSGTDNAAPPLEAMRLVSETSPAPIYGVFDPLVGNGLVGAVTTPMDAMGRATAALALEVLSRRDGDPLPAVRDLPAIPIVDWRQLRRWGLRESLLPPGTVVRFEPPSFWRQHLPLVVTTGVLFLLQSGLILSLVLQSRRRRRAEIDARDRREELAHMTRVATIGELTASLAHEINQPLAAILSNAQAAQRLLGAGGGHQEEIQEILADIAADDQRAGEVIRRMRALLRKGEFNPATLDVNELVDEVVGLVRGEMILQDVSLALDLSSRRLLVHGDRVQLQQVLLNLMVNALDAMRESPGGHRRVIVRTEAVASDRSVEVSVQDSGIGLPPGKVDQLFDPFFTTKTHGLGLGLAICRSIIQAHGGRIGCRANPGRGATVWFTLPVWLDGKP